MEFRRPLGLVLSGGAAHGAWQTGCVEALVGRHGLEFDRVLGISAGALTGAAYVLGRMDELVARWLNVSAARILRLALRPWPASIFSGRPLWESVEYTADEERARARTRMPFTVVSVCKRTREHVFARFTPRGEQGWDGPLAAHLVASCAIERVFPPVAVPVNGGRRLLVDGGSRAARPIRFDDMEGCADVIVVQVDRPGDTGRGGFSWVDLLLWGARGEGCFDLDDGIASLQQFAPAPRVWRCYPSRPLSWSSLEFSDERSREALELGAQDAGRFLAALRAHAR